MDRHSWTEIALPGIDTLETCVQLRAQNMARGEAFALHDHPWHQLVYASAGTLTIRLDSAWHVVAPGQAAWLPRGVRHATGALSDAAFRSLYISEDAVAMPAKVQILRVSGLLRELIGALERLPGTAETVPGQTGAAEGDARYREALQGCILAHLPRLASAEAALRWPDHRALRALCRALYDRPDDSRTAQSLARAHGMSGRTLARRFRDELNMPFGVWRRQMQLFRAYEWLGQGRPVTAIAMDLGYATPSAFIHMFRTATGMSPSQWRRDRPDG